MKREWACQTTKDGTLPAWVQQQLSEQIKELPGKHVTLTLSVREKPRSNNANRYYWGVVIPLITAFFRGHGNYVDDEDTHEFLKLRVGKLAQVIVLPDGEVVKGLGSTAKLTTAEFEQYLERIRAWAAEYSMIVPLPNEPPPL